MNKVKTSQLNILKDCSQISPLIILLFFYASSSPVSYCILERDTTNFYVLEIETHFCRVVFLGTGIWFFWSIVLLSFLGILAAYTALLLVSNVSLFSHSLPE